MAIETLEAAMTHTGGSVSSSAICDVGGAQDSSNVVMSLCGRYLALCRRDEWLLRSRVPPST
jgi:hypothetical protein